MLKKRKARRVSGPTSVERSLPKLTVEQGLDVIISGKKAEGLRERTLHDYKKNWQYLVEWLCSTYEEIEFVQDITTEMIIKFNPKANVVCKRNFL